MTTEHTHSEQHDWQEPVGEQRFVSETFSSSTLPTVEPGQTTPEETQTVKTSPHVISDDEASQVGAAAVHAHMQSTDPHEAFSALFLADQETSPEAEQPSGEAAATFLASPAIADEQPAQSTQPAPAEEEASALFVLEQSSPTIVSHQNVELPVRAELEAGVGEVVALADRD